VRNSGFLSLPGDLRRSRHFSQSRVSSRSKSLSCAEGIQKRARRAITVYGGLNRATVRYWAGFALAGGNTVGIANTKDRTGGGGRNRTGEALFTFISHLFATSSPPEACSLIRIEHPYNQAFPPFCQVPLLRTKNHPVLSNYSVKTLSLALSLDANFPALFTDAFCRPLRDWVKRIEPSFICYILYHIDNESLTRFGTYRIFLLEWFTIRARRR
jgi:hypothetical protein